MPLLRRKINGLLLAAPFVAGRALRAAAADQDEALQYYHQAKIDWRQADGTSLTIGLNKHPFTESLLPLIPEFQRLTGIKVDYLILPEAEYWMERELKVKLGWDENRDVTRHFYQLVKRRFS